MPLAAQFVTLEGRRFMLEGEEFRPRVANYPVEICPDHWTQRNDPQEWYVTPSSDNYSNYAYGFGCHNGSECAGDILDHFTWLVNAGFNTVRIVSQVSPHIHSVGGEQRYSLWVREDTWAYWNTIEPDLVAPTFSDSVSERYFDLIRGLLDVAEDAGMKVIFLCCVGGNTNCAADQDAVDLYAAYLGRLAAELRGHPALMAYDLWNEPMWSQPAYTMVQHTKAEVCAMTTQWYDAIKANDPDHLVTLGGADLAEIGSWDPAVMKLDFYSPHFYPDISFTDGYNIQHAIDRAVAEAYWIGSTCPIPWMIGETSFSANDDTEDDISYPNRTFLDTIAAHHQYPWMDGSEAEQTQYALAVSDATYAYGGSGFSWWIFKDSHSKWIESNDPNSYRNNFFGLQRYGEDMNNPDIGKLMVSALNTHIPPDPPVLDLPSPPSAYYNWHAFTGPVYRSYEVVDQNTEEPIPNALVEVAWQYALINPQPGATNQTLWNRMPTDENGEFSVLTPPNMPGYEAPEPRNMSINASGSSSESFGTGSWPTDGNSIELMRELFPSSKAFNGVTVGVNAYADLKARAHVEVTNTTIEGNGVDDGGAANLHAREWVHVGTEFHAQKGAEVHMYISDTWPDSCNNLAHRSMLRDDSPLTAQGMHLGEMGERRLTLQFEKPAPRLAVHPNPCTEFVMVSTEDEMGRCIVLDTQGRLVYHSSFSSRNFSFRLPLLLQESISCGSRGLVVFKQRRYPNSHEADPSFFSCCFHRHCSPFSSGPRAHLGQPLW